MTVLYTSRLGPCRLVRCCHSLLSLFANYLGGLGFASQGTTVNHGCDRIYHCCAAGANLPFVFLTTSSDSPKHRAIRARWASSDASMYGSTVIVTIAILEPACLWYCALFHPRHSSSSTPDRNWDYGTIISPPSEVATYWNPNYLFVGTVSDCEDMSRMKVLVHLSSALLGSTTNLRSSVSAWSQPPGVLQRSWKRSRWIGCRRFSSSVDVHHESSSSADSSSAVVDDNGEYRPPFFRIYYNDVYEVQLPPKHRFPMKKYAQVRTQIQKWISELPEEEQCRIDCGTCLWSFD
jgi:hypothetical protein